MRVLFHIDSLGSGGAQRQIVALAQSLHRRGHTVEFNTYHSASHFLPVVEAERIEVRTEAKSHRFSIGPVRNLVRHARDMRADAIVAFLRTPALHAEAAGVFLPGCKIVVSERYGYPVGRVPLPLWLGQQCHRLADFVTANSLHQGRDMIAQFPWLEEKSAVILNGYDLGRFGTDTLAPETDRQGIALLALGSVVPRKNSLALAEALRIARRQRGIEVSIHWAGEPLLTDGVALTRDETDRFLAANAIAPYWTWLGLRADTEHLLATHSALIHPALSEGFSNSIAEAMAAARPVLVGDVGDQGDVVEASGGGLTFDPTRPESIADAIARFAAMSDGERAAMGQAGRRFAETRLSLETMVDAYEALLTRIVGRP